MLATLLGMSFFCFNPRAREGRDFMKRFMRLRQKTVSIHAPARGATANYLRRRHSQREFQSTRPRGARHLLRELSSA